MKGKEIGYKRVSTVDQNPERQLDGLVLDKTFVDYASGTTIKRPGLTAMLDYVREDDIIIVHSMDRLARNVKDLLNLVEELNKKHVQVQFVKENLTFNGQDSYLSKLLLMIIGAVAEFEHALIRERQLEGIAIAKKLGKYKGKKSKFTDEMKEKILSFVNTRISKNQMAEELGVSRFTLYRYLDRLNLKHV